MKRTQIGMAVSLSALLLAISSPGFGQYLIPMNSMSYQNNTSQLASLPPEVAASGPLTGLPLALNLHFNIPFTLPEDEADVIDSATNFGAGVLYGRKLAVGAGFVYGRFNQQEGIVTGETSPEPIGTFQPKVKSQFYFAALRYTLQNLSGRFSPYGMLALGFLQRTFDPDLDDFDIEGIEEVDDDTRFAFSVDLGIEVLVVSPVSLTLSLNYFKTSEADVNEDFGASFLIVGEYLAVQFGTNLRL